jgi:predicted GNAT family acetyltransferase
MAGMDVTVVDNTERSRFEARTGEAVAGFATYRREPHAVVVVHTEVDSAFEGAGVGSRLVRGMLDQLRDRGETVQPDCPFVRRYVQRHWDEYGSMLVGISAPVD